MTNNPETMVARLKEMRETLEYDAEKLIDIGKINSALLFVMIAHLNQAIKIGESTVIKIKEKICKEHCSLYTPDHPCEGLKQSYLTFEADRPVCLTCKWKSKEEKK